MGGVYVTVEDGVGDGRVGDHFVPVLHIDLIGHDRRAAPLPVVEDLQEIAALVRRQMGEPIKATLEVQLCVPGDAA